MQIPSGYFLNDLSPVEPKFELSFKITNKLFTDITDFSIFISEQVGYYENNNNTEQVVYVFQKKINFGTIPVFKTYSNIFLGNHNDFDIISLAKLNNNANMSREISILLNIYVSGSVLSNLVQFKIFIGNICASCMS